MKRMGIKTLSPLEFFKNLPEDAEFACKNYSDKNLLYLEILISESAKLVCKMDPEMYPRIIAGKAVEVLTIEHFGTVAIVGNISIRNIMRDAKPDPEAPSLNEYFFQHPNSKYSHDDPLYPVGIACGYLLILQKNSQSIDFSLTDLGNRLSGRYRATVQNGKIVIQRLTP